HDFADNQEKRIPAGISLDSLSVPGLCDKDGDGMREKKKDKTAWKCQVHKGRMTVEAAFVMPLVLLVGFALLLLTMFVHNRAWYTAVCESGRAHVGTAVTC